MELDILTLRVEKSGETKLRPVNAGFEKVEAELYLSSLPRCSGVCKGLGSGAAVIRKYSEWK